MEKTSVPLSSLYLDLENPRINPCTSQPQALERIARAESQGERVGYKLINLARSIVEEGYDDSERLIVMPAGLPNISSYIVLDGNRRLAALRFLTMPGVETRTDIDLPKETLAAFGRLQKRFKRSQLPELIDVLVSEDRAIAKSTILRKHSGELEGVGRSAWAALQERRFSSAGSYQLMAKLKERSLLNARAIAEFESGSFAITTFERVAASEEFSKRFGGVVRRASFNAGSLPDSSLRAWAQVANDVADELVSSRNRLQTSSEMGAYLDTVRAKILPPQDALQDDSSSGSTPTEGYASGSDTNQPATPTPTPTPIDNDKDRSGQSLVSAGEKQALPPKPRLRKYLLASPNPLRTGNQKCDRIIHELERKVKVDDAPLACAFLLRALVEGTAAVYLHAFALSVNSNKTENIKRLAQDLVSCTRMPGEPSNKTEIGRALMVGDHYAELSEIAHSGVYHIDTGHVRKTWETLEPALRLAWGRVVHVRNGAGQRD